MHSLSQDLKYGKRKMRSVSEQSGLPEAVELCGEEDGDAYWWDFQDNYFDLFPGEVKRVGYGKTHRSGRITAKAVYDERYVELNV